ncbi:hypothetical protein EDF56_101338 [Novosphingobium sp. PhB165]|nr:hypothetical protein EDF56_101338 [Novosphingobium sp. PhB165]
MTRGRPTPNLREHPLFKQRKSLLKQGYILTLADIHMNVKLAVEIEGDGRRFRKLCMKQAKDFIELIGQAFCVGLCRKCAAVDRIYTCIF